MKVKLSSNNKFDGFTSKKWATGSGASCNNNEQVHYKKSAPFSMESKYKHIKEDSKNTNITRPAESVSFGGSAVSDKENSKKEKDDTFNKLLLAGGVVVTAAAAGALFLAHGARKNKLNPDKALKDSGLAERLAKSKTFHKMAYFSDDNEAKVKAALALGLAGILKPMCVLAMPGAEKEDKQFTATKNSLSAFIGYLLSCAILDPISSGVNKFLDNPKKYLPEDNWLIKTFDEESKEPFKILTSADIKAGRKQAAKNGKPFYVTDMKSGFKTVYKNGLGIIVAPLKAAITIALMPYVLKFIFGDSKGKKKTEKQEQLNTQTEILTNSTLNAINMSQNNIDKIFDTFTKGGLNK